MHPALVILIICVVLSILSSIFAGPLAMMAFGKVVRKFDRDFEEKMTRQVAGKDEATARSLVMVEVGRLDAEHGGGQDSKVDIRVGGDDLKCPSSPPPTTPSTISQDGTGEAPGIPILIHMRDGRATRVTMCLAEYMDEIEKELKTST